MVTPVIADETHSPLLCQTLQMNLLRVNPGLPTLYTHTSPSLPPPAQAAAPPSFSRLRPPSPTPTRRSSNVKAPSSCPAPTQSSSCTDPPNLSPPRPTTATHPACNQPCLLPCRTHSFLRPPLPAAKHPTRILHSLPLQCATRKTTKMSNAPARALTPRETPKHASRPFAPLKHCIAPPLLKRAKPLKHTNRSLQPTASPLPTDQHR